MMNQPIAFSWDKQASEAAMKAGSGAALSETGAYEADILSAVYEFGKEGSQSQAIVFSIDADGQKANYVRIYVAGRNGEQTFGVGLISAILWAAQVRDAKPQQRQGQEGPEWFIPALEGRRVGLFLQKVLTTKQNGSEGYKFDVKHVFQPGTRLTYKESVEKIPAETIAALERTVKDKDERKNNSHSGGGWGAPSQQDNGWGAPQYDPNEVPNSRLQQAANSRNQAMQEPPQFDDDIPF
ncbi:hypothetical protein [Klebsiella michiganensis]|uniref:hypothetical protein n=1 Tax=Klebsiella michiganensis TaxID=1134687 RepID=UPI00255ADE14|nr:hypothetical protein [Klebsiella michiganensis]MDL4447745.1 hypothetical protein [Klebsiella michiganensis]MDL4489455.1 hypothetical protein [Klebsiella michiganensis]MDL4658199.1 hypothetical protein [Klebsiella michiganensis]